MHHDDFEIVSGKKRLRAFNQGYGSAVVSDGNIGVLIVLKCASRSMLLGAKTVLISGKDTLPEKVHVFVRDPIERLRSVYQFFKSSPPIVGSMKTSFTWEEFIDAVLDGAPNHHWKPVSESIAEAGVDAIPHLFENLASEYPLGRLEIKNKSIKMDVDMTYRNGDLQNFYKDDYALRAKAGT